MKKYFLILIGFCTFSLHSQTDESWKLYDDSHLARVDVTIDSLALNWIYNNVQSDSEHYAIFRFKNNWIDEVVDSIGFRLRGNTSRVSQKKSFKISFNTFIKGREFFGVDKLNLNGEHNDPSIIRSKLCFDLFKDMGKTASRANHVTVYINGKYYGLYISVEHIDDEFLEKNFKDDTGNLWKCLYPADLVFINNDPLTYKNLTHQGRPVYELKTNEEIGDYSKLARLIRILNNTSASNLPDSLESVIDVPGVLNYLAMNILMGSWDDYWSLMNNYYLYHNPSEDKFQIIPYDYDNSFGVDWFNINWANANPYLFPKVASGYRPLADRLMDNNQYRDLYTHFLSFYRNNVYMLPLWEYRVDSLKNMITTAAVGDTFRTLDYGFTVNDFLNSYSASGYQNQHVKFGLKQFVNQRNQSIQSQLNYKNAQPIAYEINFYPEYPSPTDSIYVYASCFSKIGLAEVSVHFTKDGSTAAQIFPMTFVPVPNTKKVEEADRWIGVIPPLGEGGSGKFTVFLKDVQNRTISYPRKDPVKIKAFSFITNSVVINEFMADNKTTIQDPAGEYDDWIELYNPTSSPVLLTGRYLTDKPGNLTKWKFTQPNLYLNPGEFMIIWCDENQGQPGIHTNFKLSADGEFIALTDIDGVTVIDSITFGPQTSDISFGRFPDASSTYQFLSPTPGYSNSSSGIKETDLPADFTVSAFPNPFNPSTTIQYSLAEMGEVNIRIYDVLGREIVSINEGIKTTGRYSLIWDGKDRNGVSAGSGIYILRINSGKNNKSLKLLLLR